MSTTLLQADAVMTLDTQDHIYQPGYLVIENDRILETGPSEALAGRHFDQELKLEKRLVMPGLVNAHTHTPMVLFRGMAEPYSLFTFEGWYAGIRSLEAVMDADMVAPAVAVSCAEMIRTGTTCFADQYFFMDRVVPVVRQSGMRAALAYGIVEMGDPAARARELASAATFLESVNHDPRISGWVGPHAFFVDNSTEAIALEMELADRFATGLHFHLATSGEEERYCRKHYGCSAVEKMEAIGILDRRLLAAHSITVPAEDFSTLAAHPFTAVVAPSACMRSGAEIAPVKAMQQAGINLALGTDNVANNNSYDLFKEMQLTGKLMSLREHQPDAIPARDIVEMATLGGARALGLEQEIGSLERGKKADIISLDLDQVGWGPEGAQSLYTALVYSINGLYVKDVMVDGNWLLQEGLWTTLDYPAARSELNLANAELRRRLKKVPGA
jgi:5-methylthioadenosine/S-adenosylhomocysteine deaminase